MHICCVNRGKRHENSQKIEAMSGNTLNGGVSEGLFEELIFELRSE